MNVNRCLLSLVIICTCAIQSYAQQGKLPPFQMMQASGTVFKAQNLPMGKPIVLIYFSPDCDHCEKLMNDIVKQKAGLSKASVAMVTYLPVQSVVDFKKKYQLDKMPNFYVGTEGNSLFLRKYYRLAEMPFVAVYTKNGDLVKTYRKDPDVKDLVSVLGQLK